MGRFPGCRGVYAVDWTHTEIDGETGLDPDLMTVGMGWRWTGRALRLDGGPEALWLDRPVERIDRRGQVRNRLHRLALADAAPRDASADPDPTEPLPPGGIALTDGHRLFHAVILRRARGWIAVFDPVLPPPGRPLWICGLNPVPSPPRRRPGVICFLPGTLIATARGPRAIETLAPGARVQTLDDGPQPVVWCGATQLTGAELFLHPHLRPVRIAAGALPGVNAAATDQPATDLVVSPGHRLLLTAAGGFPGEGEALAAAADLEDGRRIRRDFGPGPVTYIHLMLERHAILVANGRPCESFHPGLADPSVLAWHARTLERAWPGISADPGRYGPAARRCLDTAETMILRHGLERGAPRRQPCASHT